MVEIAKLFWKKVVTADAFVLGEVHSAEVDMNTWVVTHLYVNLNDEAAGELGFEVPFLGRVTVCLPVENVKAVKDTVVLGKTLDELRELRECRAR
jgi:sporulation protein YlmC with PRC-barrel domain